MCKCTFGIMEHLWVICPKLKQVGIEQIGSQLFLTICNIGFQSKCTILHYHYQWRSVPVVWNFYQSSVRQTLKVFLICISMVAKDDKHFFFFLVLILFKLFVQSRFYAPLSPPSDCSTSHTSLSAFWPFEIALLRILCLDLYPCFNQITQFVGVQLLEFFIYFRIWSPIRCGGCEKSFPFYRLPIHTIDGVLCLRKVFHFHKVPLINK